MSLSKAKMREWPWNNRPSSKHVWYVKSQGVDACHRCGCAYIRQGGGSGPVYCFPTPAWLAEHPSDTMLGPIKTPFG